MHQSTCTTTIVSQTKLELPGGAALVAISKVGTPKARLTLRTMACSVRSSLKPGQRTRKPSRQAMQATRASLAATVMLLHDARLIDCHFFRPLDSSCCMNENEISLQMELKYRS